MLHRVVEKAARAVHVVSHHVTKPLFHDVMFVLAWERFAHGMGIVSVILTVAYLAAVVVEHLGEGA